MKVYLVPSSFNFFASSGALQKPYFTLSWHPSSDLGRSWPAEELRLHIERPTSHSFHAFYWIGQLCHFLQIFSSSLCVLVLLYKATRLLKMLFLYSHNLFCGFRKRISRTMQNRSASKSAAYLDETESFSGGRTKTFAKDLCKLYLKPCKITVVGDQLISTNGVKNGKKIRFKSKLNYHKSQQRRFCWTWQETQLSSKQNLSLQDDIVFKGFQWKFIKIFPYILSNRHHFLICRSLQKFSSTSAPDI